MMATFRSIVIIITILCLNIIITGCSEEKPVIAEKGHNSVEDEERIEMSDKENKKKQESQKLIGTWISDNDISLVFWEDKKILISDKDDYYFGTWSLEFEENDLKIVTDLDEYKYLFKGESVLRLSGKQSYNLWKVNNEPVRELNLENKFIFIEKESNKPYEIRFNGDIGKQKAGENMKVYYPTGTIWYSGGWFNGGREGKGKTFYINGMIKNEAMYKDDLLHGSYIGYYMSGDKKVESEYEYNALSGKYIQYYRNGKKALESNYKKGKLNGSYIEYYENGNKKIEGTYKNPLFNLSGGGIFGDGKEYYENGQLKYEGDFKQGKYDGKGKMYNEEGTLLYEGKWSEGEFIN